MPTMKDRMREMEGVIRQDDREMRGSPRRMPAPAPLPERAPHRGLEGQGFSPAESRAIHKAAGALTAEEREKLRGGRKVYGVDYGD